MSPRLFGSRVAVRVFWLADEVSLSTGRGVVSATGKQEPGSAQREAARHDWLVFFSPDGNEDPNDIPRLVEGLAAGYDMVIASRFMAGARSEDDDKFMFASRRWGNLMFTWLVHALFVSVWAPLAGQWLLLWARDARYLLPLSAPLVALAGVELADLVSRRVIRKRHANSLIQSLNT